MGRFASFLTWLGFNQKRCSHCIAPYFLEELQGEVASLYLCPQCQPGFSQYTGLACRLCGVPAVPLNANGLCMQCNRKAPPWSGIAYYGLYANDLRDVILRLKYDAELQLVPLLADFLLQASASLMRPDIIMAIPQHPSGLRRRGFNQAHELGRRLAHITGFQLESSLLWRTRVSAPQESLDAKGRRLNLVGAFAASQSVADAVIWLIDDVMTTGSTCAEATNALLDVGAKKVLCLFVARTPII